MVFNQQTRELISARKTSRKHNYKDLIRLRPTATLTWHSSKDSLVIRVTNTRYITPPEVQPQVFFNSLAKLQALVYDILPPQLEEGAGKRCSECAVLPDPPPPPPALTTKALLLRTLLCM